MVVGLCLVDNIDLLLLSLILSTLGKEALTSGACNNSGVVLIGREHPFTIVVMGIANHPKQGLFTRLPINDPVGIEYLVATVLRVRLGKHHQLDIVGVTPHRPEVLNQIVNLILSQCQPQFAIGLFQCCMAAPKNINTDQWRRFSGGKEHLCIIRRLQYRLGHAIMDKRKQGSLTLLIQRLIQLNTPENTALDTVHLFQPTVIGNICCFGRPRGDRSQTGDNHPLTSRNHRIMMRGTILQQTIQYSLLRIAQCTMEIHKVKPLRGDPFDCWHRFCELAYHFFHTEPRQRRPSLNHQHILILSS